jgi:hypothetical protein
MQLKMLIHYVKLSETLYKGIFMLDEFVFK